MEVFEETVAFGPLRVPVKSRAVVLKDVLGIIAGDDDLTIVMERVQLTGTWRWTLAGTSGQAFGYMTAQER